MPRRHNPRALRRRAFALQVEHDRDCLLDARTSRRAARRVRMRLVQTPSYAKLRRAETDLAVQDVIDDVELRTLNRQRELLGLPPYERLPHDSY